MTTAHTSGPWTVSHAAPDGYPLTIYGARLETGGFPIVADIPERTIHGTHEANARLIAAAPELFEALERAVQCLIPSSDEYAEAQAAIAKATGAA